MVSTQHKEKRASRRKRDGKAAQAVSQVASAAAPPETESTPPRTRDRAAVRVGARQAGSRIRGLAEASGVIDVRNRLRRLARQVEHGAKSVQRLTFAETAIGGCIDEAANCAVARERWLLCEAATWALAWMARTRRAGGSAGSLLEGIVREARVALPALAGRDTQAARFVTSLARLFGDIEACRCLEQAAADAVAEEIVRLVSPEGTVALAGSAAVLERVIRWTGCREVAVFTGRPLWNDEVERRWAGASATALRLLGGQGRILSATGLQPASHSAPLFEAVETADATTVSRPVRRTARAVRRGGSHAKGIGDRFMPRDLHDPAAAVAILRTGWGRGSLRILLEYRESVPRLEIAVDDRLLVDGPWQWTATAAGRPLEAEGAWSVSCWETDRKASFLEIVAPLAGGLQIERQIVVLRRDAIVLLADTITHRSDGIGTGSPASRPSGLELGYRGGVPLVPSLDTECADETREVVVFDTRPRFMALPLALPEWRTAGRGGLRVAPEGLVLEQQGQHRLHAPLWLDFESSRVGGPLTWRQLTVADTRQNLPAHQAAGYRIQAGDEQWLVYRALDVARNRTLLGCNVSAEFLVGRIKRSGEVARTLEIH